MVAHAAAIGAPGRVPAAEAEAYSPPGQSSYMKIWRWYSSRSRYMIVETPLKQ